MFFKKKKKVEEVVEPVEVVEEQRVPDAIESWGTNGKEIVCGYILKASRMWNYNNPNKLISDEVMDQLMTGLRMAFTSIPPEKAIALFEKYSQKEENEAGTDGDNQ